ncbi:MAG: hypothetical protein JSV88_08495 [Candidatus Aminicenantes bacterium]|nr:MAG: hypothetical protein JSV88_08495 [Candidatus Aminicenantes bacterium]
MKRILVFVGVLVLGGFILNASPQVNMSKAATYDITGVWRVNMDEECQGNYYFFGDYFKFVGTASSGTLEEYLYFERYYDEEYTYRVDDLTVTMSAYGIDFFTGTFQNKNTIVGNLYSYDSISCLKFERVVNDQKPFGNFELPANGAVVSGSIPISGWALDDTMITSIKIYYSSVSGSAAADSNNWYLIEDEVTCLWGARPDVAYSYWDNYYCEYAGWGYMCLTYFLPNGGYGPYMLHVVATDIAGNSTTWSVTVYGDNANRVKPFGAIDTPEQCGWADVYASEGYMFRNWGWALTPWPNFIPANGIGVYVDGVKLGNVTYDLYRSDIANFFPGYANTYGAGGYFDIDLSNYEDFSQHTLSWFAADSAGNKDGIGSRYFYVSKWDDTWSATAAKSAAASTTTIASLIKKKRTNEKKKCSSNQFADIPVNRVEPISIKRGFNENSEYSSVFPDETGINRVNISTGERIEIKVSGDQFSDITGYTVLNENTLGSLPVGSTLDKKNKTFYWIPGPGFMGKYECLFIEKGKNGEIGKRKIEIEVNPNFKNNR